MISGNNCHIIQNTQLLFYFKSEDNEEMRSEKEQNVKSRDKEKAKSEEILTEKAEEVEEKETKFEFEEVYNNDQEDNWKNIDDKSKKRKRKETETTTTQEPAKDRKITKKN
ncbi:hypothetical protein M9Y10_025060 [Tritrichomonas musculus]|uniref:Uncharacterized protein n=1 Tax=Tritrichomonas musculus TaxID=1915356 RepID=A0ABR2HAJ3_9EUKA